MYSAVHANQVSRITVLSMTMKYIDASHHSSGKAALGCESRLNRSNTGAAGCLRMNRPDWHRMCGCSSVSGGGECSCLAMLAASEANVH